MNTHLKTIGSLIAALFLIGATSFAMETIAEGTFIEKQKSIKGNWSIVTEGDQRYIRLGDDFKAKNGPDLKLFLSPMEITSVNGKTATKGSVLVAKLKSVKGGQRYPIADDIDLAEFKSLLVHCEKYAVLWGGGKL